MDRTQAWDLLNEFTQNPSLIKHGLAVEASMRHYARHFGEDVEKWGVIGLLHDFDYERFPEPPDHPAKGAEILRERGVDEEIVGCIMSHAEWNLNEYPRDTLMRKALAAVDELSGFIVACALVRPERLNGLKVSSVKKKMKTRAFAAAVSRDDIRNGAELLEIPLEEHIEHCVSALQEIAADLELG